MEKVSYIVKKVLDIILDNDENELSSRIMYQPQDPRNSAEEKDA